MTIQDFSQLSMRDKLYQLWERGRFIKCRVESKYSISVYKWNNYIMEIWYEIPGTRIEKILESGETVGKETDTALNDDPKGYQN